MNLSMLAALHRVFYRQFHSSLYTLGSCALVLTHSFLKYRKLSDCLSGLPHWQENPLPTRFTTAPGKHTLLGAKGESCTLEKYTVGWVSIPL